MPAPTDEVIAARLIDIISDGFNRSLRALVDAGAIDATKMHAHYTGTGSKFYDLVTEQINLAAKSATPSIRQLFDTACNDTTGS